MQVCLHYNQNSKCVTYLNSYSFIGVKKQKQKAFIFKYLFQYDLYLDLLQVSQIATEVD